MDIFSKAKNNVFLAPMAGITDRAFREICSSFGAGLCYTEMVSSKGLSFGDKKTRTLLCADEVSAVQLFGSEPETIAETAAAVQEFYGGNLAFIDVNMGCPAPKIFKNGDGCALMSDPDKAAAMIRAIKRSVCVPVTAKFRSGLDSEHINAVSFALAMQDAGADAVCVHGRTRVQMYSGRSDRGIIAAVKRAVCVPVLASGDIFCPADIRDTLAQTGCDGVLVARGSMGNPFIFREYLNSSPPPDASFRIDTAIAHLLKAIEYKGERRGVVEFRKHAVSYVRGMQRAAALRSSLSAITTADEMIFALKTFVSESCCK